MPREERRANLRVPARLPTTIKVGDGAGVMAATMRNVSTKGANIATRAQLREGDRAMLDIEFDDWTFRTRVLVRHAKPIVAGSQLGCEFVELSAADVERVVDSVFAIQRERTLKRLSDKKSAT